MNYENGEDEDIDFYYDERDEGQLTDAQIKTRLQQKPYYDAVKMIRHVSVKQCPFEKLFLMNEIRKCVDKNIEKFWAGI